MAIYGSTDHRDLEGVEERATDSGGLPQARDQHGDVQQIQGAD